jgi:hypothetical protein
MRHLIAGLTALPAVATMEPITPLARRIMDTPSPHPSEPSHRRVADDAQVRSWLKLREELAELNARLEYLRLIVSLGVRRIG